MADFPYFDSNMRDFPSLAGLDGQSYRDTYDYSQYGAPAKLRLLDVPWRSDYSDVVHFESEAARDNWLSRQSSEIVEYSMPWLRIPAQSINIPLPYDRAAYFNYLYLDIPARPIYSGDEPTRLCYFIMGIKYAAPSTTTLELELDVWQTYIHRMSLETLYLERGHYPMRRVDVADYLDNPIGSTRYLLAKDVDYSSGSERIAGVKHYPIGQDAKWLVMALPISPADMASIGAGSSATSTPPSYSDTSARNGYQLNVTGYVWAHGGYAYPNAALDATAGATSDGRTLDGSYIYAIQYPTAKAALAALAAGAPHVLKSAAYVAILPDALIDYGADSDVTIAGYTWQHVKANPQVDIEPFQLTKQNIGLPAYAADIAKAYTYPYTRLKVQDQEGRGFEVRIEDIVGDSLEFNADVSLASASLICNIEASNVGTSQESIITWATLDGSELTALYGSDLSEHMIEWGVPTYSVRLDAGTLEAARRWRTLEAERQAALNAYHQTARSANTSLANTQDYNSTNVSNTVAGNATAVSNTARANQASVTNTANSGNTANANQTLANNRDSTIAAQNNTTNQAMQTLSHQQAYDLSAADDEFQQYAVDVGTWGSAMAGVNNMIGAAAQGNIAGVVSTGFGAALSISTNQAMAQLSIDALLAKQGATVDYIDGSHAEQRYNTSQNSTTAINAASAINTNNVTLANTNAQNSATASNANATDSAATSDANARASAATSNANAGYSRADAIAAAKENLEQAQRAAMAALDTASLDLIDAGAVTGDNSLDALNRRSFAVKVVTQDDYALHATCDYWQRYGYTYGASVTPTSWLEQGRYCYWKGSHAIIKGNVPDVYRNALEAVIEQGVTVWATPEEVGDYEAD